MGSRAVCKFISCFLDEIQQAKRQPNHLSMPNDRRLRKLSFDELPPPLQELAQYIGASEKPLLDYFIKKQD